MNNFQSFRDLVKAENLKDMLEDVGFYIIKNALSSELSLNISEDLLSLYTSQAQESAIHPSEIGQLRSAFMDSLWVRKLLESDF